jgi:hypothetical protein
MSIFLVYFEFPSTEPPIQAPTPLITTPLNIIATKENKTYKIRGATLTNGHSSEWLLFYGNNVAARRGEQLRNAFFTYINNRLSASAKPYIEFMIYSGAVTEAKASIASARPIKISDLPSELANLKPSELANIIN